MLSYGPRMNSSRMSMSAIPCCAMRPPCPRCGGLARPNVLMFGDWGWIDRRSAAQAERQEPCLSVLLRPVVVEVGAGTAIPSVRRFSGRVIDEFGGRLVRINPGECEVPNPQDVGLRMGAGDGMAALAKALGGAWEISEGPSPE